MFRVIALALALVAAGCVPTTSPTGSGGPISGAAQNPGGRPTFGTGTLSNGFNPSSATVEILAGGRQQARYQDASSGRSCTGYFAESPDYRLNYGGGGRLSMAVTSQADTLLLVRAPDGSWHCNDDSQNLNPALSFPTAQGGSYDIWVGTYNATPGGYPSSILAFSQGAPSFASQFTRAFFGNDDRVVVQARSAPWNMIGLLEFPDASCTGVLIGPSTIVTSGHCLADNGRITRVPTQFRAGYQNGNQVASSGVSGYHVPQGWLRGEREGYDFAFVYLSRPLGNRLGWMDVTGLTASEVSAMSAGRGPDILQAGYSFDQPEVMTGNLDCPFVGLGRDSILVHQCDTLQGDSGSPLFIRDGNRYRLIGVESRTDSQPNQQYDRNVAMYTDFIRAEIRALGGSVTSQSVWSPLALPSKN